MNYNMDAIFPFCAEAAQYYMWFHLTTLRLYLPNADSVAEKLHSDEFVEIVANHRGRASYVLECAERPTEFTYLTAWDSKEDAENFFMSEIYASIIEDIQPHLVAPLCECRFEVLFGAEKV
ncbi:MAG: hypothetical protein HN741_02570 [Anaerolineae bacterium]|nr:hypothetical protein [Anaerolineae bacterium]